MSWRLCSWICSGSLPSRYGRHQVVDLTFDRERSARRLAQPDQSLVGMHLREQQIGATGQADRFDGGDFHGWSGG